MQEFIEARVRSYKPDLREEWALVKQQGIKYVNMDVRTAECIPTFIVRKLTETTSFDRASNDQAASEILDYAVRQGTPTMFHLDEVGAEKSHDIDGLRNIMIAVWRGMHERRFAAGGGQEHAPRVFFLVTGKSTEPLEGIGKSGRSPCTSYFLVLNMLEVCHLKSVRKHLQDKNRVETPVVLNDLNEARDGDYLDRCISRATGGAPRLLLYTLRALHVFQYQLSSEENIDKAMDMVFNLLYKMKGVKTEFLPAPDNTSSRTFKILLALSLQGTKLSTTSTVKISGKATQLYDLLRFQPFFLSRVPDNDDAGGNEFKLILPNYHLKAARLEYGSDAVPMLLLAMAGATVRANEPWCILEMLTAHIIATKAAMQTALSRVGKPERQDPTSWADAMPSFFKNSKLAKMAEFNLGRNPYDLHLEHKKLPTEIENDPGKYADMGGALMPRDKSESGDVFHVQRKIAKYGLHQFVTFDWQPKLIVGTELIMSIVRDESAKCSKTLVTVFTIFAATIGPQLLSQIGHNDVLVLKSWKDDEEAEYVSASDDQLLWRKWKQENDAGWKIFPTTKAFTGQIKFDAARVRVRPNLEIVIPSATVVRGAVGPERFDLLTGLSTAQDMDSVISTLDEVFDENYTSGKKRARDTSQTTPAVVVTRTLRFQRNRRSVDVAVSSLPNETVWNVLPQHNPTAVFRNVFATGPNRQRLIDKGVKYRCFQNPSAGEFADADFFRMSIGQLCELSEQQPYCFNIEYKDMGNVSDED